MKFVNHSSGCLRLCKSTPWEVLLVCDRWWKMIIFYKYLNFSDAELHISRNVFMHIYVPFKWIEHNEIRLWQNCSRIVLLEIILTKQSQQAAIFWVHAGFYLFIFIFFTGQWSGGSRVGRARGNRTGTWPRSDLKWAPWANSSYMSWACTQSTMPHHFDRILGLIIPQKANNFIFIVHFRYSADYK